ncbi:MAG: hypothetical protein LBM01_00675 [Christensenellaceae bacterium]|jgi:hypothetical protein|nr:hypothetical protein [Christensenellaceae bacterium]
MKQKIGVIILAAVLILGGALTAILLTASANAFKPKDMPSDISSVSGNGGTAVLVGSSLYFVDGYIDRTTITYKQNEYNKTSDANIKRVSLSGGINPTPNAERGEDFNLNVDAINNAEVIVPKIVGTQTTALWIFGDKLIYTTPNNQKNKNGALQNTKLDFFVCELTGAKNTRVWTTATTDLARENFEVVPSGSEIYLYVYEESKLKQIVIKAEDKKVGATTVIAEDVSVVKFPKIKSYNASAKLENAADYVMGFVYYSKLRDENSSETILYRSKIGSGSGEVLANSVQTSYELVNISAGYLTFKSTKDATTNLVMTDETDLEKYKGDQTELTKMVAPNSASQLIFPETPTKSAGAYFYSFISETNSLIKYEETGNVLTIKEGDGNVKKYAEGLVSSVLTVLDNVIFYDKNGGESAAISALSSDEAWGEVSSANIFSGLTKNFFKLSGEYYVFGLYSIAAVEGEELPAVDVPAIFDKNGNVILLRSVDENYFAETEEV